MHLRDEQLTELDDAGHAHISECKSCRERANNLVKIRQSLTELPQLSAMPGNWKDIQKIHSERQQAQELKKTRQQLNQWRIGSFALAASLTAVVLWPGAQSDMPAEKVTNWQLATLIEQNNYLQQQLSGSPDSARQTNVRFKLVERDIQAIDQAIQRAYLQNASDEEKTELWKERQKLMKQLLSKDTQPKMLRI